MILKGNNYTDNRGNVIYFNDFDFKTIKRFYQISNHSQFFIRAWHGHKNETKYFNNREILVHQILHNCVLIDCRIITIRNMQKL